MNSGTASTISGAYIEFQAAVLKALPRGISDEQALRWANDGTGLTQLLAATFSNGAPASKGKKAKQQPTPPAPAAEQPQASATDPDGMIVVTVGGETFELFPFTQGKPRVSGPTMLAYGEKHKADMDEKTMEHFEKHWGDLPASVRQKNYLAFPKVRRAHGGAAYLLDFRAGPACRRWSLFGRDSWDDDGLLVRRRVSPSK